MITSLLGTKSHMEQAFNVAGHRVPVSVVKTQENVVTQLKTLEKDGYSALQVGFGWRKAKHTSKQLQGHFKKVTSNKAQVTDNKFPRFLRETKTDEVLEIGTKITPAQVLKPGDLVKVTGTSKGKGFAGGMKRWGFAGGPKTHGQSDRARAPGSIGQGTTPGRVHKGKKMAGRMGGDTKTIKNLIVLKVDEQKGEIWLSGAVPGNRGGLLVVEKLGESKHFQQLYSEDIPEEVIEQAMEAEAEAELANRPEIEGESEGEGKKEVIGESGNQGEEVNKGEQDAKGEK